MLSFEKLSDAGIDAVDPRLDAEPCALSCSRISSAVPTKLVSGLLAHPHRSVKILALTSGVSMLHVSEGRVLCTEQKQLTPRARRQRPTLSETQRSCVRVQAEDSNKFALLGKVSSRIIRDENAIPREVRIGA